MAINQFELTLNSTKMLTPTVLHLAFTRTDGEKLEFIPGQFITFLFTANEKIVRRSYSISTLDLNSSLIEIAVSPVKGGLATEIFFNLQPGAVLTCSGPFGRLILPVNEQPAHSVLVATGTGVSPYRAMLPQIAEILQAHPTTRFTLLFGAQYRHDLLYLDDFVAFAAQYERFEFRAYLSRETELKEPYEYKGYVQHAFTELNLQPEHDLVYLCGNPNMIDDAFAWLLDYGFATSRVKREKYISGGATAK